MREIDRMPGLYARVQRLLSWGCMACCVAPVDRAVADTVTLVSSKDNTLFQDTQGDVSNGAGDSVFCGRTGSAGGGIRQRAVLAFDVAGSIPQGSTITSVTLMLVLIQSSSGNQTHTLYRLNQDWGEGTSVASGGQGAPATANDATWLYRFFPGAPWSTVGGSFHAIASASAVVAGFQGEYFWTSPAMAADVQSWLDNPCTNFGWI